MQCTNCEYMSCSMQPEIEFVGFNSVQFGSIQFSLVWLDGNGNAPTQLAHSHSVALTSVTKKPFPPSPMPTQTKPNETRTEQIKLCATLEGPLVTSIQIQEAKGGANSFLTEFANFKLNIHPSGQNSISTMATVDGYSSQLLLLLSSSFSGYN